MAQNLHVGETFLAGMLHRTTLKRLCASWENMHYESQQWLD
jgi:hypothetical protein